MVFNLKLEALFACFLKSLSGLESPAEMLGRLQPPQHPPQAAIQKPLPDTPKVLPIPLGLWDIVLT